MLALHPPPALLGTCRCLMGRVRTRSICLGAAALGVSKLQLQALILMRRPAYKMLTRLHDALTPCKQAALSGSVRFQNTIGRRSK